MAPETDADIGTADPGLGGRGRRVSSGCEVMRVRRLGGGVADQMVSSVTNFAVCIYVAYALGATQFGAFSLAFAIYGFALNASRGLATDPLMVRFSGTSVPIWRRAVADCTGTASVVGLVTGSLVLEAAAVLSGAARAAFLVLGLTLPGLLLQDSWRYSFITLGRSSHAFVNDTIWALTLLPALAMPRMTGHANVLLFCLAWGLTATIAAAVGPLQARVIPKATGTWLCVSRHSDLGSRYLAEGLSSSISSQLRVCGIGPASGPSGPRLRSGLRHAVRPHDGPVPWDISCSHPGGRESCVARHSIC